MKVWRCNECGADGWTSGISEEDVHLLACIQCGGDEWTLVDKEKK